MENWYVPLTILPSVGFFIVATTSVSNALSGEIARLIEQQKHTEHMTITKKIQQLRLVSLALVLLYSSGMVLALAGLIAGVEFTIMRNMQLWVTLLICVGIGLIILAFMLLIIYSMRAVRIKERQFSNKE